MSIVRGVQPKSKTRKPAREGLSLSTKLGLLAAGSLLPILAAPAANAQCTAVDSNNQPLALNALTSSSVVTCSGSTTNENVSVSPPVSGVLVQFLGAPTVTNSNFALYGDNHAIGSAFGSTFNNVGFVVDGANTQIVLQGSGQDVVAIATGANSIIALSGGPWNAGLVRISGDNARIEVGAGATVVGVGNPIGLGVLSSGDFENNAYAISGALVARTDGVLITDAGGNDAYYVNPGASFSSAGGAVGQILDSDGVSDAMHVSGTQNLMLNVEGIELLTYSGSASDTFDFRGTGEFTRFDLNSGDIGQFELGSLMTADAVINIASGASLRYGVGAFSPAFSQTLLGTGAFQLDGAPTQITGDNSGFSGTFLLTGTAMVENDNAFGVGNVINQNGSILLSSSTIGNQISGSGQLYARGGGSTSRATLSGINTYSGGSFVTNAGSALLLTNASAAGTGAVEVGSDAFLELDFGAAGGDFTNLVTGDGSVRKVGSGLVTLANVANDYTGGTQIDGGILRVTDLDALGTGPVVANAGGALRYDYSGPGNQNFTTPLMTGAGQFIKAGSGTIVISNANTWTGGAQILEGRVGLNNGLGLGAGDIDVAQGGILGIGGVTLANNVTGAGQIIKTANNTAVMTGTNTLTGGIVIEDGAIEVASGDALGAGIVDIQAGASLLVVNAADTTVSQQLQGNGAFVKNGAGRAELTGNNSLGGVVAVNGGTLAVGGTTNIGAAGLQVATGATLEIARSVGNASFSNDVTGDGRLIKTGASTVTIGGNNSYTGGTHIMGGALRVSDVSRLGSGGIVVDLNAALDLGIAGDATFSQAITGAGILRKSDVGSLTLLSNTLTGGLDITQGNVTVNTIAALGSGPVTTAQGATLTVDSSATEVSSVAISGSGGLVKDGLGDLIIQNANTYTGGTTINASRIGLNNGQGLGTGGVLVNANGVLGLGGVTVANAISGAGSVLKTANNVGSLTGVNSYSGGTVVQGGTLSVTSTSAIGTGGVSVASGATFEMSNASNQTFANALSGAGTFRKAGAGDLTFSNAFSVGALAIDAGRVRLNAAMTGNATIGAGGILNGIGQVNGTLTNNGIGAPGNSLGTLNVQGNYVHNANSILEIEFDAAGGIDLLNVSGSAQLNGGTLRFVSLGGAEGSGGTFLTANGGVTGTFANVETVGAQLPLAVIYQTNAGIMAPSVLTARPSTFNSQALAASDTLLGFADTAARHALRSGQGSGAWAEAFTASGSRDAAGQTLTYDHDSSGVSFGVSGPIADRIDAGVAFGWSQGDVALGSNGGGGQQDGMLASAFARYRLEGGSIGAGILYGAMDQSTVRNITFSSVSASVAGETDSVVTGAFLSGDIAFGQAAGWSFGGAARASYLSHTQDAYTEAGASPLRLELPELTFETADVEAAGTAATSFMLGATPARVTFEAGVRHTSALDDRIIPVSFAASNAEVNLQGDAREHTSPFAGADFEWSLGGATTLTAGYQGRFGDDERHEARVGVHVAF